MKEGDLREAEICEEILGLNIFTEYQEMLRRWLEKENQLSNNYEDVSIPLNREDANRREYKGGCKMLQKIINKPEILKERLKRHRQNPSRAGKGRR